MVDESCKLLTITSKGNGRMENGGDVEDESEDYIHPDYRGKPSWERPDDGSEELGLLDAVSKWSQPGQSQGFPVPLPLPRPEPNSGIPMPRPRQEPPGEGYDNFTIVGFPVSPDELKTFAPKTIAGLRRA